MDDFKKYDLFGIAIAALSYDKVVDAILAAARVPRTFLVATLATHGLTLGAKNVPMREMLNQFDLCVPDGQPVRWALNRFYQAGLQDRVYGPELTWRLCAACAQHNLPIFLYGSLPTTLEPMVSNLKKRYPHLVIAGAISPPFRPLTPAEEQKYCDQIRASGAKILLLGLGCPKQENYAFEHRDKLALPQVCVGAAFDFIAGTKKQAPAWMQRYGLEWLFRLCSEPNRLYKRYFRHNTQFILLVLRKILQS